MTASESPGSSSSPSSSTISSVPKKGEVIVGKYRVDSILGKGGMGVVVTAEHLLLHKQVAIKFLLPSAMELPGAAARFLREAQSSATIQSEHVARVLDVGQREDGTPFMVMEFLSGSDLSALLRQRMPLPVQETVDLVLQACEALAEAHAAGIIHRDLKPGNLFVTKRADGSPLVKVLDFGLSKVRQVDRGHLPEGSITESDAVLGSPQYMSPEQFRSFKNVDARTDIWALGVILYYALSGKRPFDGDSFGSLCMSIITDDPPPLRSIQPEIPQEVETAIQQCLVKDPKGRTQSVTELARALAPFGSSSATISYQRIAKILPVDAPAVAPRADSVDTSTASSVAAKRDIDTASAFSGTQSTTSKQRTKTMATLLGVAGIVIVGAAFGLAVFSRPPTGLPSPASAAVEHQAKPQPAIVATGIPSAMIATESTTPAASSSSLSVAPVARASASAAPRSAQNPPPGKTTPAPASSTSKTKYDAGELSF